MILEDCMWYKLKEFSIGSIHYCSLYDEEIVDCESPECKNYKKSLQKAFLRGNACQKPNTFL